MKVILFVVVVAVSSACTQPVGERWSASPPPSPALPDHSETVVATPAASEEPVELPVEPEPEPALPPPEPIAGDPIVVYLEAEPAAFAAVEARALERARELIRERQDDPALLGPALQWYPALGVVAAYERRVTYGEPRLAAPAQRSGDPRRPLRVSVLIPCRVATRSGQGVAVTSVMPEAQTSDALLPVSSRRFLIQDAPADLHAPIAQAIQACLALPLVDEVVSVSVPLAYDVDRDELVLVEAADTQP